MSFIIPRSTYRLQFNSGFTFADCEKILDYLDELGISHLYASPIFQASPGSMHGYDITDPGQINPELGGEKAFIKLSAQVTDKNMGWLQDVVPNHMAFDGNNRYLISVLESGANSPYFEFFDIDWDHPYESIKGKVLTPFLGKFYGVALEKGEIRLIFDENGFAIQYYALRLPLSIDTYSDIISHRLKELKQRLKKDHPDYIRFLGITFILKSLPEIPDSLSEQEDHVGFVKQLLWNLYNSSDIIQEFIDDNIRAFNGTPGDPASFDLLDGLINKQLFSLSFWKVASEEINYKRFFNVNGLISLNIHKKEVFEKTQRMILKQVKEKRFTGLRIDHIDGLYDPALYLDRLDEKGDHVYTLVEKILEGEEKIPADWKTAGTTGYDFMNKLGGIFVKTENHKFFNRIYRSFSGIKLTTEQLMYQKKRLIIDMHMSGEIDNLARQIKHIASHYRYGNDLTFTGLKEAIEEVMVYFPIYRTYFNPRSCSGSDREIIRKGINRAGAENPQHRYELEFLQKVLLLEFEDFISEDIRQEWLDFVMRFQQFTGPLMAKGMEDTVYYIFNRLLCLNEVGGNPGIFGYPVGDFHKYNQYKLSQWPHSMNASSTHDTKRGEDVRMRLAVLSEQPGIWDSKLKLWSNLNRKKKKPVSGTLVPNKNEEYFLYQTLIGTYPFDNSEPEVYTQRIQDYIIKAIREAKIHTAWIEPDAHYEQAFLDFVADILDTASPNQFLEDFQSFQAKISFYGAINSLGHTLIKICTPGIPDFYQGSELWELSLVDPDNRGQVDYATRIDYLRDIRKKEKTDIPALHQEILSQYQDGRVKLYLIYKALQARNEYLELFQKGEYIPVSSQGLYGSSIFSFARRLKDKWIIVVIPRFITDVISWRTTKYPPLGKEVWADSAISLPAGAPRKWKNVYQDQILSSHQSELPVAEVLETFPMALLVSI